ncbi:hypothetical protein TNCV_2208051 [Trichonephila clavipes]|uniref:Uncharacterized protein n=1 Tax=Trichonephila clavipes TaxID=2585209 RepID=A0A8X6VGN6_TRICX|nr:hypothetical protein TNCV_2208051 [Trichonephila clavipes]
MKNACRERLFGSIKLLGTLDTINLSEPKCGKSRVKYGKSTGPALFMRLRNESHWRKGFRPLLLLPPGLWGERYQHFTDYIGEKRVRG